MRNKLTCSPACLQGQLGVGRLTELLRYLCGNFSRRPSLEESCLVTDDHKRDFFPDTGVPRAATPTGDAGHEDLGTTYSRVPAAHRGA